MNLYAIKFGESSLFAKYIYRDIKSDEKMQISWSYYLAQYNNKTILFDVGFRDQIIAEKWGITLINIEDEINHLTNLNQIDVIFITHSHFDHIDNLDLFRDSLIIISYDEYMNVINNGKPSTRERLLKENVITVKNEFLFDNKFKFKVIGGHSIGSSVIYFEENNKSYVITGDECYNCSNLIGNRPIGVYSNTEKNESFISDALQNEYIPLPCHDLNLFNKYKKISSNIVQII